MKRRSVFLGGAASLAALAAGTAYVIRPRDHAHLTLDPLIERLAGVRLDAIETSSSWDVARTLNHLAQGVEFSMEGYPDMRSALFRHTVGPLAFGVFQARGAMSHDTAEVIPGEVVETGDPDAARTRLIASLQAFDAFEPELSPHFAFGHLDKTAYTKAHAMHVQDHLTAFRVM